MGRADWIGGVALALTAAGCSSDNASSDPAGGSSGAEAGTETSGTAAETETGGVAMACVDGSEGFPIAMPTLPAGDPEAGYEALLTEDYVSCGIPWDLFTIAEGVLGIEEPLPGRTGKNAEVGHAWNVVTKDDGSELVVSNCLQCHAGRFNGELIVGLGKAHIDNTDAFNETTDALPALPETSEANIAFNKFKQRISVLGPSVVMATVGANPAVMYAIGLLAHRDPQTLAWQDEPRFELLEGLNLPADTPPWWRAKKKASHFSNGMSRGDHRGTLILASSLCTDTVEDATELVDYFADIQAFITSLEAPDYPFAIDNELAAQGEPLFDCYCAGCHGTYDADPAAETYPNLIIPTDLIGTDPLYANQAGPGGAYHFLESFFNDSYYGSVTEVATADPVAGYTAPPLDGIWATAAIFAQRVGANLGTGPRQHGPTDLLAPRGLRQQSL